MFLARVDGTLTATIKHQALGSLRLLIVQRLEADGSEAGEPIVAGDPVGARHGALVMVTSDGEYARTLLKDKRAPLRLTVLGIVDAVDGEHFGRRITMRPPAQRRMETGIGPGIGFGRLAISGRAGISPSAGLRAERPRSQGGSD
jgi:microcompartment protein CcmK/EutM